MYMRVYVIYWANMEDDMMSYLQGHQQKLMPQEICFDCKSVFHLLGRLG